MTQEQSRLYRRAELVSNLAQAQFFAKDHAAQEEEFLTQTREAKTLRLRNARMAKELRGRTLAISGLISLRAKQA
jgi:hypothetical protein